MNELRKLQARAHTQEHTNTLILPLARHKASCCVEACELLL